MKRIPQNLHYFDDTTRRFLSSMQGKALRKYLERKVEEVLVFDPVERDALHGAFCDILALPAPMVSGIAMVGVCDCIYSIEPLQNSSAQVLPACTISLLGHELIHALQADAYGGSVPFVLAYRSYFDYNNPFEWAAYRFGGRANHAIKEKAKNIPDPPVFG